MFFWEAINRGDRPTYNTSTSGAEKARGDAQQNFELKVAERP
jgi:hypothetical protein